MIIPWHQTLLILSSAPLFLLSWSMFRLGICSSRLPFVSPGSQSGNPTLAATAATAAATSAQAFLAFWISPRLWQVRMLVLRCVSRNLLWVCAFCKVSFNFWIERFFEFHSFCLSTDCINRCSIVATESVSCVWVL